VRPILFVTTAVLFFAAGAPVTAASDPMRAESRRSLDPDRRSGLSGEPTSGPSPRKAFLFSLLVPGLGQAYGSGWDLTSWTMARGALYGAFETVAWVRQQDDLGRGLDKQTEYRLYADANWHWKELCADWNGGDGAIDDDPFLRDDIPGDETDLYIDTEPERLEFYEDIHKLQKWICGWDDYDDRFFASSSDSLNELWSTDMQLDYRSMRREQNELMTAADHWLYAIVANHLVSAFDAYFTAKRGAGEGDLSFLPVLRVGGRMSGGEPGVALAWRF
jgi:hypothetical protein